MSRDCVLETKPLDQIDNLGTIPLWVEDFVGPLGPEVQA